MIDRQKKNYIYHKKWFKGCCLIILLMLIGSIWQQGMENHEKTLHPPPGELIDVNNHKMHLYRLGKGDTTMIFIGGSGTPYAYTDFYYIQEGLQDIATTISFDPPGFGWSEGTSLPRTIENKVNELQELLKKAGFSPPYILIGHSLGSLEAIHYAQTHPEEVDGIILLDGGNPSDYLNEHEFPPLALNRISKVLRVTGLLRLLGSMDVFLPLAGENIRHSMLPDELRTMNESMYYSKIGNDSNISTIKHINENAQTVVNHGKLGNIPLLILTAGKNEEWVNSQQDLMSWSSNSTHVTIEDGDHYIHWSHKDKVINKIREAIIQMFSESQEEESI